jgi:predicted MFS family arabinose efflux permease
LIILAIISLAEQTALNSISPYLPQMTSAFPDVDPSEVGVYVGTIASAYALAQFLTNFFWGWLSDRIGRKPVVLTGTILTAACFVAFGFCKTFGQAVLVQVLMGLSNGNQGVISTCLGEITDRSNQSRAFTYLPIVYGIGGITGPFIGGLLAAKASHLGDGNPYPYLLPNLVSAGVLMADLVLTMVFLEESLEEAKGLPPLGRRVGSLFVWTWQFASSYRPSYLKLAVNHQTFRVQGEGNGEVDEEEESDTDSHSSIPKLLPEQTKTLRPSEVLNRDTLLLLISYGVFQLSNISYNSLYPILGQAAPPLGRGLSPREIGISLAFAGAASILVQIGIFGRLRDKMGNRITYRSCLAGMVLAYMLTPWVGYKHAGDGSGAISYGKTSLYVELGIVLLIRAMAAVGCLTSALLLVCSSRSVWMRKGLRFGINIDRSPTLPPTPPFLGPSTASLRHFRPLVGPLALFSRVVSSPWRCRSGLKVKSWLSGSLVASRFWVFS